MLNDGRSHLDVGGLPLAVPRHDVGHSDVSQETRVQPEGGGTWMNHRGERGSMYASRLILGKLGTPEVRCLCYSLYGCGSIE